MADPLSVTASIIAIITAAEGVSKALVKIGNYQNIPNEFLALMNEVSDLKVVMLDIDAYLKTIPDKSSPLETLQHTKTLLIRGKEELLELDRLIQYQLIKPETTLPNAKVSRHRWIKAKKTYTIRLNRLLRIWILSIHRIGDDNTFK